MGLEFHKTAGFSRGIGLFPQFVDGMVNLTDALVAVHHLHFHHHLGSRTVKQGAAPGIAHHGRVVGDAEIVGDQIVVLDSAAGKADFPGQYPVHVLIPGKPGGLALVKIQGVIIF